MVFSSPVFLFVFLPFALVGFYLCPHRLRKLFLIGISLLFFAWGDSRHLPHLIVFIGVNYIIGQALHPKRIRQNQRRQGIFYLGLLFNLSFLGYFKYTSFVLDGVNALSIIHLRTREDTFFLGVSFLTFGALSYLLDIYHQKKNPPHNLTDFICSMVFFPKFIQGPITRSGEFFRQLNQNNASAENFSAGAERLIRGLAKKVIIADQLGVTVDKIFASNPLEIPLPIAWLGAIAYTFQIYFDFSGYTDMAIGLGKMFGITLPENFNYPYISKSVSEFWRRWHITLSNWFRDYVFYPLEFKRRRQKEWRQETNTLIVFFLTGLWHGASLTFIVWGLWHGLLIAAETFLSNHKKTLRVPAWLSHLSAMLAVVIGWVIFRGENFSFIGRYLGVMFGILRPVRGAIPMEWILSPKLFVLLLMALIFSLPVRTCILKALNQSVLIAKVKSIGYLALFLMTIVFVLSSSYHSFLYFKF